MKKTINRITLIALVVIMSISVVACGKGGSSSSTYKVDEVKQKLIDVLNIEDLSELREEDRDTEKYIGYGDWDTWFDCYVFDNPKDAPDIFDIQTIVADFDEKLIDKKDHKVWVAKNESDGDDSVSYSVLAMKGNLVLSITSEVEPEIIMDALDLD